MLALAKEYRWTSQYPELGTGPVPVEPYLSPEYFDQEREKIFKHTWLQVGRVEEIPNHGDYFVRNIQAVNTSVIIVRDKNGSVRGFHNVCKHRGTKLVWNDKGCEKAFSCNYHGWTYTTEGACIGVPEEEMFFDFKKSEISLTPVATEVWEGFIFVNFEREPKESLKEYLGELDGLLSGYPYSSLQNCYAWKADLRCNWKLIVDSQQEGYHAKMLHRRSVPGFLTNKEHSARHTVDMKCWKRHRLISYFGNRERTPTPIEGTAWKSGAGITKREWQPENMPLGVNPARSQNWSFDEYVIFPNFHLLIFFGMYITHNVWPVSHDRSIWEARVYLSQPENAAQVFTREYSRVLLRDAWLEDGSTLEASQEGIESGAISHFLLQDQELCVRHFAKVIRDYVGA
jgi:phenylpropionate dioxygenase-like ring-hydroxylating dioxygenase large terminal subunit